MCPTSSLILNYQRKHVIITLFILVLFFIIHFTTCFVGITVANYIPHKNFVMALILKRKLRQKLLTYVVSPFQVIAILTSSFWVFRTAVDVVTHPNVRLLMLSTGYVCFVTPVLSLITSFAPLNVNVLFYFTWCSMTSSLQLTIHGVMFLIERYIATKWSSTYENKNATFSGVAYITLTWIVCIAVIALVDIGAISMTNYTAFLSVLEAFMVICVIVLFKINVKEYKKPIHGLSERYQRSKNICFLRSLLVCTIIQFIGNFVVTLCLLLNRFVFIPRGMETLTAASFSGLHVCTSLTALLIPVNFILWKRNERRRTIRVSGNARTKPSEMYRGVTGNIVPLKAEADVYFKQLQMHLA